jgi:hypothetical protein
MRSRPGVVVLALLVALAGCNGLAGTDTGTETAAVTPVSVPATEGDPAGPSERAREWPPGLSNGSLVDPVALARAHVAELDRRSYIVWQTRAVVASNGTVVTNRTIRGTFSAGERYRVVIERRGPSVIGNGQRVVAHADGQRTSREVFVRRDVERRLLRNRSGIDMQVDSRSVLDFRPDFGTRLRWALTAAENTTVDRQFPNTLDSDDASYHVEADIATNGTAEQATWSGTLSATVDANGIVRLYSLAYTTTRDGERVRIREQAGYVNLVVAD